MGRQHLVLGDAISPEDHPLANWIRQLVPIPADIRVDSEEITSAHFHSITVSGTRVGSFDKEEKR